MKLIKKLPVLIAIIAIIFLGGAFLIPDKQFYAYTRTMGTDPVAVYSGINNTEMLNAIVSKTLPDNEIHLEKISEKEFTEINYLVYVEQLDYPLNLGFLLKEKTNGTELTGFFQMDSLNFPVERWKGFLIPMVYKNSIKESIDVLERTITE